MLDSVINKHLDRMEALEAEADRRIDEIISKIEIDELMDDPEAYLNAIKEAIIEQVVADLGREAIDEAEGFVESMIKKDQIIVGDSTNPKANAE